MFETLMEGQSAIKNNLLELKTEQNTRFAEIDSPLNYLKTKTDQIEVLQAAVASLQETVWEQDDKLTDLEDGSRRSNLVIFGLPESPSETEDQLRTRATDDLFRVKLGVPC